MMDGVEVALEIAFNHVVMFDAAVGHGHEDCNCVHRATTFAEAVGVRVEIRLVNRVEDGPKCLLHDAVSQGGDAQRALLAIVLGYVDSPDGLRFVRLALQLVDEHRHLALVVRLERNPRHAIHAVGLATRSRQYPFSRYVHPVVPVQQVVQVGEPVVWMLTGRLCQEPLLFLPSL